MLALGLNTSAEPLEDVEAALLPWSVASPEVRGRRFICNKDFVVGTMDCIEIIQFYTYTIRMITNRRWAAPSGNTSREPAGSTAATSPRSASHSHSFIRQDPYFPPP